MQPPQEPDLEFKLRERERHHRAEVAQLKARHEEELLQAKHLFQLQRQEYQKELEQLRQEINLLKVDIASSRPPSSRRTPTPSGKPIRKAFS